MRRILFASLFALGLSFALPPAAFAQLREGLYDLEGQNPDGTIYRGMLEMRTAPGSAWFVAWRIGDLTIQGIGVIQGSVLAVGYAANNQVGVATYEVQPDGKLSGLWSIGAGVGSETLTPKQ